MIKPLIRLAGMATAICLFAATSHAVIWNLATTMNGASEVPPNGSAATGSFTATWDDVADFLSYHLVVNNLGSGATLAHVHGPAGIGQVASPIIDLIVLPGQTSFVYDGIAVPSPANAATFESLLQSGTINAYVNVHSTNFPAGEIRGQLAVVPEPATLLVLGPAAFLALRRKFKR